MSSWRCRPAARTPDEFRREVAQIVRQLAADDGVAKLERQKRAVRLRAWIDQVTGMLRLSGEFDPETGASVVEPVERPDRNPVPRPDTRALPRMTRQHGRTSSAPTPCWI